VRGVVIGRYLGRLQSELLSDVGASEALQCDNERRVVCVCVCVDRRDRRKARRVSQRG
jgi:hypothetical protein